MFNLDEGLLLEDYNILIKWYASEKEIFDTLKNFNLEIVEHKSFKYKGLSIYSKVLGLNEQYLITFNFVKSKLVSINFLQPYSKESTPDFFYKRQALFESIFGKPKKFSNIINIIFNIKDSKRYVWKMKKIKIVHEIFDEYQREIFEILIK